MGLGIRLVCRTVCLTMDTRFSSAFGDYKLQRLPRRPRELLRAWDAADEYLLQHLVDNIDLPEHARIVIYNDSFGALAVALHRYQPQAISDSWLSQSATRMNLIANKLPEDSVRLDNSLQPPSGTADLVLIKIPKTLALLEDELIRLRPVLTADTPVIAAGMVKGMPSSVWKLLQQLIGPTTTSLAKKKARLIFSRPDPALPVKTSPYPVSYRLEGTDYQIRNHANVFSRDSLDIGTRFFLQHLPRQTDARDIVDLGCGNGLLGLIAAQHNPGASLHFVDESHMAVASAQENFRHAFADKRQASFQVGDGLSEFSQDSADLILCNPPFHQQSTIGDQIANRMFGQSKQVLRAKGELWVIGNRHLAYPATLRKLFRQVTLIAENRKFVILRARP